MPLDRDASATSAWEKSITPHNRYQNGAYWATPTGWLSEIFEGLAPGRGVDLMCALVDDFREHGVWECIGLEGYQRVPDNLSSIVLPYRSFKTLLGVA